MISFAYFAICLSLAFRSLALACYGRGKVKNLALFFLYAAFALPFLFPVASAIQQELFIKIGLVVLFIGLACFSVYRHKRRKLSFRKCLLTVGFFAFGLALAGIQAMDNLSNEKPILKVCLTGKTQARELEWKNPSGPLRQSLIDCHEIAFQRIDGKEIARFTLPGDLIGVRAKVLRFHPWLNAIGIPNKYQLDMAYSGYHSVEGYQTLPMEAHSLAMPSTFLLLKWWNGIFFNRSHQSFWFKSANLQSNYFPMIDESGKVLEAEYLLTLSSSGLSATRI